MRLYRAALAKKHILSVISEVSFLAEPLGPGPCAHSSGLTVFPEVPCLLGHVVPLNQRWAFPHISRQTMENAAQSAFAM